MKLRLVLVLFGFACGLIANRPGFTVKAQDAPAAVEPHSSSDLTLREVIEAMAEFDVKHVEQQPFFQSAYGLTDFSSEPPAIWIFRTGDMKTRQSTVIHELKHIHYHNMRVDAPEPFVLAEEDREFRRIFGLP